MYGFAFISVLFHLAVGLLLLFSLILLVNLVVYRSFKFPYITKGTYLGAVCGTLLVTGILGTLWNWYRGEYTNWYGHFIDMPIYGALWGGYPGRFIGEQICRKASLSSRRGLIAISFAIALAAFYSYFYTGALTYNTYYD